MTQRISVSIPEHIYEKLQLFKDRLNVSRICQYAITQAINLEEMKAQAEIKEIETVVARLKKERRQYGSYWEQEGFKDGVRDAHKMSYEDLMMTEMYQDEWSPAENFNWGANRESKDSIKNRSEPPADADTGSFTPYFYDFEDVYFLGWVIGVLHVWKKLKDHLTAE